MKNLFIYLFFFLSLPAITQTNPPPTVAEPDKFQIEEVASVNKPIGIEVAENGDIYFVEFISTDFGSLKKITFEEDSEEPVISTLASSVPGLQYIAKGDDGYFYTPSSNRLDGDVIRINPNEGSFSVFIPGSGGVLNDARGITFTEKPNGDQSLLIANNIISFFDPSTEGFITKMCLDENGNYLNQINSYIGGFPQGKKPLDLESIATIHNDVPVTAVYIASDNTVSKAIINDESGEVISFNSDFAILPGPDNAFAAGIAITPCGKVYVSQVTPGAMTGGKVFGLDEEGNPTVFAEGYYQPRDLDADPKGNLVVSDFCNNKIYKISSAVCGDFYACEGFENERTGNKFSCLQAAIDQAESGDKIFIRTTNPGISGSIPAGKTIILSSPPGESREVDELTVSGNASIKGKMNIEEISLGNGDIKLDGDDLKIGIIKGSGNILARTGKRSIDRLCIVLGNVISLGGEITTFEIILAKDETNTKIIGDAKVKTIEQSSGSTLTFGGDSQVEVMEGIVTKPGTSTSPAKLNVEGNTTMVVRGDDGILAKTDLQIEVASGASLATDFLTIDAASTLDLQVDGSVAVRKRHWKKPNGASKAKTQLAGNGNVTIKALDLLGLDLALIDTETTVAITGEIENGGPDNPYGAIELEASTQIINANFGRSNESDIVIPLEDNSIEEGNYAGVGILCAESGGFCDGSGLASINYGFLSANDFYGAPVGNNPVTSSLSNQGLPTSPENIVPIVWDILYEYNYEEVDELVLPVRKKLSFSADKGGSYIMDHPVVVIKPPGSDEKQYILGESHPGEVVTTAGDMANENYNTVSFETDNTGGQIGVFGCQPCEENPGKVLICIVNPRDPSKNKTKCIGVYGDEGEESSLIDHLNKGNYCGPCEEEKEVASPINQQIPVASQNRYQGLQIYPNPARDRLTVTFDNEIHAPQYLRLVDLSGRIVREQYTGEGALTTQLNVKGLSKGLYFLQIRDDEQSRSFKVLVE